MIPTLTVLSTWPRLIAQLMQQTGIMPRNRRQAFWMSEVAKLAPASVSSKGRVRGTLSFIGAILADKVLGFADTSVQNRELRQQNIELLAHNRQLEAKLDRLLIALEKDVNERSGQSPT